jgi:hypothetical protein
MKYSNLFLLVIAFTTVTQIQAQSDFEIRIAQNSYVKDYTELSEYIGSDNSTVHSNFITYTSQLDNKMIINFDFTVDKLVSNGSNYYNLRCKGFVVFADIEKVYVSGDKIICEMNSNGFANRVKAPGGKWTETITNTSDYKFTVKDASKRAEILHIIEMLMKYPVYRVRT